jgi:hypothetical protein
VEDPAHQPENLLGDDFVHEFANISDQELETELLLLWIRIKVSWKKWNKDLKCVSKNKHISISN